MKTERRLQKAVDREERESVIRKEGGSKCELAVVMVKLTLHTKL
jgi:hypothetical protein